MIVRKLRAPEQGLHIREDSMSTIASCRHALLAGRIAGLIALASAACRSPSSRRNRPPRTPTPPLQPQPRTARSRLIGRPGQRRGRDARAGRAAAAADAGRQAADRQAQAAERLQDRGLCQRHRQRTLAALGDKGTVFVGNRFVDKVYRHRREERQDARSRRSRRGLYRPNGLAFHNGTLYIAELSQISKLDKIEDNLDNPPKPTVIYTDLPNHQSHGWKYIGIGPDNKLYINVGPPCNICVPPAATAQIRRLNLDGSGAEVYARGRAQLGRLRLASGEQATLLHRQRPRLAVGGSAGRRAQPRHQGGAAFRLPLLLSGQAPRPEMGWGQAAASSRRRSR